MASGGPPSGPGHCTWTLIGGVWIPTDFCTAGHMCVNHFGAMWTARGTLTEPDKVGVNRHTFFSLVDRRIARFRSEGNAPLVGDIAFGTSTGQKVSMASARATGLRVVDTAQATGTTLALLRDDGTEMQLVVNSVDIPCVLSPSAIPAFDAEAEANLVPRPQP